uniref:Uncharacterized protein n=1 Tax=Mus musculus TaxID=10090 RepID=Q9CZL9_MOUSE|nr:unnamed protein product [Mus musculus]
MAEMAELCEPYEESNELQMDVLPGEGYMEVGRGARGPAPGGGPHGGGGRAGRRPRPARVCSPRLARTWKATSLMTGRTTTSSLKRSAGAARCTGCPPPWRKPTRCSCEPREPEMPWMAAFRRGVRRALSTS